MLDALRSIGCLLSALLCSVQGPPLPVPPGTLPAPPPAAVVPVALPPEIPREVLKYRNALIREIRATWGDGEPADTFFGQVHQESRWQTDARSKYASGLAQFTPDTARWMNGLYPVDLGEICTGAGGCPTDPRWALRALVLYDDRLYRALSGTAAALERWAFTLAGYNSGPGNLARERKECTQRAPMPSTSRSGQLSSRSWITHRIFKPALLEGEFLSYTYLAPRRYRMSSSEERISGAGFPVNMRVISVGDMFKVRYSEVPAVFVSMMYEFFVGFEASTEDLSSDKKVNVVYLSSESNGSVAIKREDFRGWTETQGQEQSSALAIKVSYGNAMCDPSRWFGVGVQSICLRKAEFCTETRNYVHSILNKWAPLYRNWLVR